MSVVLHDDRQLWAVFAPEPTPSPPHLVASDFDAKDDDDDDDGDDDDALDDDGDASSTDEMFT